MGVFAGGAIDVEGAFADLHYVALGAHLGGGFHGGGVLHGY